METSLIAALPNLSIGVIAVLAFAYTTIKNNESREKNTATFLGQLQSMRHEHEMAMKERETAFRELEKEVRNKILDQLTRNTAAMEQFITRISK